MFYNFNYRILGIEDIASKEYAARAFEYLGKDKKGLVFTGQEVTSTYDEAVVARDFMLKNGYKSLILVTSTYHMRRALKYGKMPESLFLERGLR